MEGRQEDHAEGRAAVRHPAGEGVEREAVEGQAMTTPLTRTALIAAIKKLPTGAATTEGFEQKLRASGVLNDGRAERAQKEHWLGWLGEYDGPGHYGRQTWEDRRALNRSITAR